MTYLNQHKAADDCANNRFIKPAVAYSGGSRLPALGGPRGGQKFTPGGMEI